MKNEDEQRREALKAKLKEIKVLFRQDNGTLWGFPYGLEPGQDSGALLERGWREEPLPCASWVYLGNSERPLTLDSIERECISAWLDELEYVPENLCEWCEVN